MSTGWFVEERVFHGGWAPAIYDRKPSEMRPDGHRREFREAPVPVPGYLAGLSLTQIVMFMSKDGEFRGYDEVTRRGIAEFLRDPVAGVLLIEEAGHARS